MRIQKTHSRASPAYAQTPLFRQALPGTVFSHFAVHMHQLSFGMGNRAHFDTTWQPTLGPIVSTSNSRFRAKDSIRIRENANVSPTDFCSAAHIRPGWMACYTGLARPREPPARLANLTSSPHDGLRANHVPFTLCTHHTPVMPIISPHSVISPIPKHSPPDPEVMGHKCRHPGALWGCC